MEGMSAIYKDQPIFEENLGNFYNLLSENATMDDWRIAPFVKKIGRYISRIAKELNA